ncbi:phenylacetate--CoA ligase family protein [Vibrio fluvialis]|uniref:hypothetical protein n=1 Tax=Vibrio fluvialis TaxID=676 RepID=UPI001F430FC4|nr:hypothetical protein [Vibrio fluvialis]MCE7595920.1 hypothetical protein [Vibrio fluvialis]
MKISLFKMKEMYKSMPYSLTRFIEFIPFSIFCGKSYRQQCRILDTSNFSAGSAEHVTKVLDFSNDVIKNVPFYIDFCKKHNIKKLTSIEDFQKLPLISKEMLLDNASSFMDHRYSKYSYEVSTGGTTGKQLSLLMENDAYGKEWAFVNSYIRKIGGNENSRRLCLRGVSGIKENHLIDYNPLYKEMLISPFHLTKERLESEFSSILEFEPKWIHGYPSSVALLAKHLKELGLKINSVDFILLVSEKIYEEQRQVIADVFGNNIFSFYGMTERVIFAPLINNEFIPDPSYCLVEEFGGELVGTGFINRSFPILRYRTGDAAITKKDNNGIVTSMTDILGRWGRDYLVGKSGVNISMTSLNVHCDSLKLIDKFQFVQEVQGECYLDLVLSEYCDNNDVANVYNVFQSKVGSELDINVRLVDSIELSKRGKHSFIRSKLI